MSLEFKLRCAGKPDKAMSSNELHTRGALLVMPESNAAASSGHGIVLCYCGVEP